ncbi:5-formyltetrahydrofolate cyclo-ligase [Legionella pneumophila]|nr:5-formyltetrahydrofolate cyclo-ligase [Legionella pneumophila]
MSDQYKVALRNTIKQVRSKLSVSYRTASSNQICTRIRSLEQYRQAKRIALYFAVNGEIDLTFLWKSAPSRGSIVIFRY